MDKTNKLKQYYNSLIGLQENFQQYTFECIEHYSADLLKQEIDEVLINFPNIIPPFEQNKCLSHWNNGTPYYTYYNCAGIQAYLRVVLGRLKVVAIEEPQISTLTPEELQRAKEDFVQGAGKKSLHQKKSKQQIAQEV
ncbi:MAG: hypothetical protein MRK02_05805 [Candidatus Scalindua sp.]|nr:hypothetical protein [Candidatus Scalindua sp.]